MGRPSLDEQGWSRVAGVDTAGGRLKARTDADTEYLSFECPRCNAELSGGWGIYFLGERPDGHAFAFEIACADCGLIDRFKIEFGVGAQ